MRTRRRQPLLLSSAVPALAVLLAAGALGAAAADEAPLGFLPASVEDQAAGEEIFLGTPTPAQARRLLRDLTEEPHVAGTEGDRRVAEMIRDKLREFGFDADLATYQVLLNYPTHVSLKLLLPEEQDLSLFEDGNVRDKDSFSRDAFPAFHGYGASGTAEAQVVYVNYGTDEDFRQLADLGVEVKGRIVLARYGQVFRGLKVREAQRHGAAGVVLYSDPADDGYMKGDIYPDGPMRPPSAIQRGSVQFLSEGPGDPQTPGRPSTPNAKRIPRDEVTTIPKIPSLPISYGEAAKILRALAGPNVPGEWQGGLPFAYHVGPGPARVRMEVEMDYGVRPIWNPVGRIEGAVEPDRWIVVGNHHDAWTYGAVDPNSGTASFLEAARGIGAAVKTGWRPRRTLIFAGWDGEEYGLLGSTEWVEDLAEELDVKAVAYLNLDSSVTGHDLGVSGTPSLRDLLVEVAGAIGDPVQGKSIGTLWVDRRRSEWARSAPIALDGTGDEPFRAHLDPLGSGSDYTAFFDHLGIASLNFSFSGGYGVYHSTLDNLFWMESFGDPEFLYHAVAARLLGLLAMRLAGADVVPLRYVPYAETLEEQLDDLRREAIRERRIGKPFPGTEAKPIAADFGPVLEALAGFRASAETLDAALDEVPSAPPADLRPLNDAVVRVERALIDPEGLPGRKWFRHALYAPGLSTGYASWPFPGLAQAVKEHDAGMWDNQVRAVVARLEAAAAAMDRAASLASP